jgi:hypothetical protein
MSAPGRRCDTRHGLILPNAVYASVPLSWTLLIGTLTQLGMAVARLGGKVTCSR